MFLDLKDPWPPAPPNRQPKPAPRLTPRRQRIVVVLVAINLVMMLIGPLAGSSVIEGLVHVFR